MGKPKYQRVVDRLLCVIEKNPKFAAALVWPLLSVFFKGFLSNVSEKVVHLTKAVQKLIIWLISSPQSSI